MPRSPALPRKRILVVDDDPDWRAYLAMTLDELGYGHSEASGGEEAVERMREEPFSVVLLDLSMPGMRGEEVVKHLPKTPPSVVFLTAATATDVSGALRQGPYYYLPKISSSEQLGLLLQSLEA